MKRKLFSADVDEEDEIDFEDPNLVATEGVDLNEQMIKNLDSTDEKLRELSCISIANLSSSMEPDFYSKFVSTDIIKKLVDRITDPYSQISYNSLAALQRLTALCKTHGKAVELEASFQASMLVAVLKTQSTGCISQIRAAVVSKIESKEKALSKLELT
jgi:hypothetical protein